MLWIPITPTNMDLIVALNGGVQPPVQFTKCGGVEVTYLLVEPGEPNRVVTHEEMWRYPGVKKTMRKFYYA